MATKMTYGEQLKHPNWQKRRLEMLADAGWTCRRCEATDITLHVHHKQYFKGRMAWEYEDNELDVLCEDCHALEHEMQDLLKALIAEGRILGRGDEQDPMTLAVGLLAGYFEGHFAGEISHEIADRAYRIAPLSFMKGLMLGGMAGVVRTWKAAEVIREAHDVAGWTMRPEVERLTSAWAAKAPAIEASEG